MNKKEWKAHEDLKRRLDTYYASEKFFRNDALLTAAGLPHEPGVDEILCKLFDQILADLEIIAENLGKEDSKY